MMESRHAQRKNEHLSLAAKYYDQVHQHHYFDQERLIHDLSIIHNSEPTRR